MRPLLAAALTPALAACAHKPAAEPQVQRQQTWEEFIRERPDTFIQSYEANIAAEAARLRAAGLAKDLAFIRAQVDAHLPPGDYTLRATGANAAILRRLRVDSTANYLIGIGYRARHFPNATLARMQVHAAAGTVGGPTQESDLAIIAPTLVVADRVSVDSKPDGSAEMVYRIVEPLKGAPPAGRELRLGLRGPRQRTNPPPPEPGESDMMQRQRVVLMLQPPETVVVPAGMPPLTGYKRLTMPMPVDGERVLPGYHSMVPETTLPKMRAAIKMQRCTPGYMPVGQDDNPPKRY